jgi:hypothetical protein
MLSKLILLGILVVADDFDTIARELGRAGRRFKCEGEPNFVRRFRKWYRKFGKTDAYVNKNRRDLMTDFCNDCQEEDALNAEAVADPNTNDQLAPKFVCENNPNAGKSKPEKGIWANKDGEPEVMHDGYAGAAHRNDRRRLENLRGARRLRFPDNDVNVPDSYDWTDNGYDFPVQDQGSCGSCWSFSSAEGAQGGALAAGIKKELSVQWAYDCSVGNDAGGKSIKTFASIGAPGYREGTSWAVNADVHGGCNYGGMMDFFYNVMGEADQPYLWQAARGFCA